MDTLFLLLIMIKELLTQENRDYLVRVIASKFPTISYSDIDDIIQDTYISLYNTLINGKYEEKGCFRKYAVSCAIYKTLRFIENRNRRSYISIHEYDNFYNHIEEIYDIKDLNYRIHALMNKVSPAQREILQLKFFEEMKYKDIAKILNVNVCVPNSKMVRAMQTMRKHKEFLLQ